VSGNVVYVRENTLVARPFDLGSLEFTGDARIVVEPVNRSDGYARGSFSVSNTGVLVYGKSGPKAGDNVAIVDRSGTKASTIESETGLDDLVASQDARMLAMMRASENGSGVDIWTYDLERRVFTRATFTDRSDDPVFSPDGNTIAYSLAGNVVTSRTSGVGQPTELYRSNNDDLPVDWSRDGTKILFLSVSPETRDDVWVYDIATGNAEPILNTSYRETHPQFSPDGKWIAYASDESGRQQVYVIDYPRLMQKVQVSRDGGQAPRWRADGRELFFIAATESMARTHRYAVSPDGSSFYVIESGPGGEKDLFNVLVGWPATLGMSAGM
jgi:Tol biopolymer transport system component